MAPELTPIEELHFNAFRRKVRDSELLSSSTVRLAREIGYNGRITVIFQNGRILKTGYEEGYFSNRDRIPE
jgi:hypothetical protein